MRLLFMYGSMGTKSSPSIMEAMQLTATQPEARRISPLRTKRRNGDATLSQCAHGTASLALAGRHAKRCGERGEKSMQANLTRTQKFAALFLIVALGLALRLRGLDRAGFNEDEINKVEAARAYLRGNFSLNLEHPMLMKSMIAASLTAADSWNQRIGRSHPISEEVAVRLPNVIFGALTAVVIFFLAQEFFGAGVGLLSALFWATGTIAIMGNRVAKEDTLLVFFTWLAYYFYLRAKKVASTGTRQAEWYYGASGASFGLMLASKYFPHYLGLNFLFYALLGDKEKYPPRRWRDTVLVLGACAAAFFLFNPVVLQPNTLRYML